MATIEYNDAQLTKLFAALDEKKRVKALKAGFRKEANKVRKAAVENIRSSGLRTDADLLTGVRALVFKKSAGFRVTVGPKQINRKTGKGEKGMHLNRWGQKKPVLFWADMGTYERRTEAGGGRRRFQRLRSPHSTGRMPRYGFMAKTASQVKDLVTDDIHAMVIESVTKIAQKYGCK